MQKDAYYMKILIIAFCVLFHIYPCLSHLIISFVVLCNAKAYLYMNVTCTIVLDLQSIIPGILQGDKSDSLLYGSVDNGKKISWNESFHAKVSHHLLSYLHIIVPHDWTVLYVVLRPNFLFLVTICRLSRPPYIFPVQTGIQLCCAAVSWLFKYAGCRVVLVIFQLLN